MNRFLLFSCLGICFILTGCEQLQQLSDAVFKPSARTIYAREFRKDDSIYQTWQYAYAKAKQSNLTVEAPSSFAANVNSISNSAYGYKIQLQQGEQLVVEVKNETISNLFFIDFFQFIDGELNTNKHFSTTFNERKFSIDVQESGQFLIVIQPEILFKGNFQFRIYTQPTFQFPVQNATNYSIKSFWGASRDGGSRSHEGVDIFEDRGTPVLAANKGTVTRTGNYGLGGKQVWLRDGLFGYSLYYAHLDSIIATRLQQVEVGDTLGLVGNTGNARTTPPHLHFGIYTGSGAVNPYPFIQIRDVPSFESNTISQSGRATNSANLRLQPNTNSEVLRQLEPNEELQLIAKTDQWWQVITKQQEEGFLYESLLRED